MLRAPLARPFASAAVADLPRRIIVSISSDIGLALATKWLADDLEVAGTYRTQSLAVDELKSRGATLAHCDLVEPRSIEQAVAELKERAADWDVLVLASGLLEPIGPFVDCQFDDWLASIEVNFSALLRVLHGLLPARRRRSERGPVALFFAGGGTNSAPQNYSAYIVSKIACIKMVELLDAEISDTRFAILGPGWVKTKIHQPTLAVEVRAGPAFAEATRRFAANDWVSMEQVVACCERIIEAPRKAIGGRNISLVYDHWDDPKLYDMLAADPDLYKLRRLGNDTLFKNTSEIAAAPGPAEQLGQIIAALPEIANRHAPDTSIYRALTTAAQSAAAQLFGPGQSGPRLLGSFGEIVFPYRSFGAVDTLDFFGLDELIILAFYWVNRDRYKRVGDIGANVGWHSLALSRCGYEVRSYEPDPKHVVWLNETLAANAVVNVKVVQAAVSDQPGEAEFVRVLGNTTGSHLAGAKANPYGKLERFAVPLVPLADIMEWADLIKIDAEGHEANMILSTTTDQWKKVDVMLEIGSTDNANAIFAHCERVGANIFAQKRGWARANSADDLPHSYKEGSAFITCKTAVPGFRVTN